MDVAAFERMAAAVVGGGRGPGGAAEFAAANAQMLEIGTSLDNISLLQSVFDASSSSPATLVAANSLNKLVTDFWTSFSEKQRVEIRT